MPSPLQTNPDELVEREAQKMGRGATMLGHTVTFQDRGEQVVQTLVYELDPLEVYRRSQPQSFIERRVAVYVDGDCVYSGIVHRAKV